MTYDQRENPLTPPPSLPPSLPPGSVPTWYIHLVPLELAGVEVPLVRQPAQGGQLHALLEGGGRRGG